jgi:uncharacterized protein
MPAKFVVKKGPTGKFRFSLLATNGQVVASSQVYETKAAALAGVRSVQRNAPIAVVDDRTAGARPAPKPAAKPAAKKPAATTSAAKKPARAKPAATKAAAATRQTTTKRATRKA